MYELTEETRARILARDLADREGQVGTLVGWVHEGEGNGQSTTFFYPEGKARKVWWEGNAYHWEGGRP